ncbi:MAG: peptidoglycan-binding domain-containing protein [Patescibacteria group bacterium]
MLKAVKIGYIVAVVMLVPYIAQAYTFTQFLQRGSSHPEVRELQIALKSDVSIYPEGIVSGYFGLLTEKAVQRFQAKYGIVSQGNPASTGYGLIRKRTRTKLNEVFSVGISPAPTQLPVINNQPSPVFPVPPTSNTATNENALKFISPKAGDAFHAGDIMAIRWKGGTSESKIAFTLYHSVAGVLNSPVVDQFRFQYGAFDPDIANNLWNLPNTGIFNWKIPGTFSGDYTVGLFCLSGCSNYTPKDMRDYTGVITIGNTQSKPSISHIFFRNNGDPVLYEGKTYTVDWAVTNPPTQNNVVVEIIFGDYQGQVHTHQIPFNPQVNSFQLPVPMGTGGDGTGNKRWIDVCLKDTSVAYSVQQYLSCDRSVTVYVRK